MFKLFIMAAAAGSVLAAGLVSCRQEKNTTDVYHTQMPVIRTSQGALEFNAWDLLKNKQFDLYDILDFSASHPARIAIKSHCRAGAENFYGHGDFHGVPTVKIWQTLPLDVLTMPFTKRQFACGFEINLYNAAGSNHVYTLAPVPVLERNASEAHIVMDAGSPLPPRLTLSELQAVRLRFNNAGQASAAKLICEDLEFPPLPFEQVVDIAHFNFAAPVMREPSAPERLETHPVQNCRGLILEGGEPAALSNMITITLPRRPPEIHEESTLAAKIALDDILRGTRLTLHQWTVSNPGPMVRTFHIPRAPLHLTIWRMIQHPHLFPAYRKMRYEDLFYRVQVLESPGSEVKDGTDMVTVKLEPGQSFGFRTSFQATAIKASMPCGQMQEVELHFENFAPIVFEELDPEGTLLESFTVQPKSIVLGDSSLPESAFLEMPVCYWN